MRSALLLPTIAALALCGGAAAAALTAPDAVLLRPAAGEVLVAGADAVVEWTLDGTLDPGVEEWEAFLSFDGGGFYAVRLTPHLDASRRRFSFRVPALATDQARILLRFGDERREVGVEIPHRFAIRLPAHPVAIPERTATGRGEAARPGEPGVVAWVEGSRRGDGLALVRTSLPPAAGPVVADGPVGPHTLLTSRSDSPALAPAGERPRVGASLTPRTMVDRVRPASAILLLGCRQNE